jgi:Fe-Mn family superoxide dismutase
MPHEKKTASPPNLTRRQMVRLSTSLAAVGVFPPGLLAVGGAPSRYGRRGAWDENETYPFSLPPLPYAFDALEPAIDTRTMEIHHGRHHRGYVDKLNTALEGYPHLHSRTVGELVADWRGLPKEVRTAVRNNGGGHLNHSLFWPILSPAGGGAPVGTLAQAIKEQWGTMDDFRAAFGGATGSLFGSGWGWLVVNPAGRLEIVTTPNQDNPLSRGMVPIVGLDVWEHAYYLRYQNRRGDYIDSFWSVVDWSEAQRRFAKVRP